MRLMIWDNLSPTEVVLSKKLGKNEVIIEILFS
jgi:hypothetical protein